MGNSESDRLLSVRALIEIGKPLSEIVDDLAAFEWDYDGPGVELTRQDVANVLKQFVYGKLSKDDVELWANLIESREDISVHPVDEVSIAEAIYKLANPSLTQPLSQTTARELIYRLETPTEHDSNTSDRD